MSGMAWTGEVAALASSNNTAFHALVVPLSLMTRLTYTATYGSYFEPADVNASIPGWERPQGFTLNPHAGARALFFWQDSTRRGVVAFRGTDWGAGDSGDADRCADALLMNRTMPRYCDRYSAATLDYWGAVLSFVQRVRTAFPRGDLLYTGHSLGAALALAVGVAAPSRPGDQEGNGSSGGGNDNMAEPLAPRAIEPAIAFSAPPWLELLAAKVPSLPLPDRSTAQRFLYALADEYDPIQAAALEEGGLYGTQCIWSSPRIESCELCFPHKPLVLSSPTCQLCVRRRHVYKHYLEADVPGPRPSCSEVGARAVPAP